MGYKNFSRNDVKSANRNCFQRQTPNTKLPLRSNVSKWKILPTVKQQTTNHKRFKNKKADLHQTGFFYFEKRIIKNVCFYHQQSLLFFSKLRTSHYFDFLLNSFLYCIVELKLQLIHQVCFEWYLL